MALILFLETSTRNCSVALAEDGVLLQEESLRDTQSHASVIQGLIQTCLIKANKSMKDLSAVALAGGPGSYTGLRIGMSVAKGICYALDLPLLVLDSLEALAQAAVDRIGNGSGMYVATMDSRKGEIYYLVMNGAGTIVESSQALELSKQKFDKYKNNEIYFFGNTFEKINYLIFELQAEFIEVEICARSLIKRGFEQYFGKKFTDVAYIEPNYMKPFSY